MINLIRKLFWHKFLLYNLVKSEIKSRYKQTFLGLAWIIFQPVILTLLFTVVFSKFAKIPSDGLPYPVFSFTALTLWMFFAASLNRGAGSIIAYSNLIRKIYFPREIIVFSYILAALLDMVVYIIVLAAILFYYKITLSIAAFWILPIIFTEILLATGIALILSALSVFARDIIHALPLFIQIGMFLAPIAYPMSVVPVRIKTLYMLNPMAAIVNSGRDVILKGSISDWNSLIIAMLTSVVIFIIGYGLFKKLEMKFADVI